MMLQDWDYEAHISNTGKVSGEGMNLKQKTKQWHKAEAEFVDSCIDVTCSCDREQEAMFDLHPEKFLVHPKKHGTRFQQLSAKLILHKTKNQPRENYIKTVKMTLMMTTMIL